MAKVEVITKKDKKPKWEPFATITVSKRELGGLFKLVGAAHYRLVGGELYHQINKIIGDEIPEFNDILVTVPDLQIIQLDTKFGEV